MGERDHFDFEDTVTKFGQPKNGMSKVLTTCPVCCFQRQTTLRCIRRAVSRFGDCLCASCRSKRDCDRSSKTKLLWKDREYVEKAIGGMMKSWSDPDKRARSSLAAKAVWSDPNHVKKMSDATKLLHSDKSYRSKYLLGMKRLWSSSDFRQKIATSNLKWSKIYKRRRSEALAHRWKSPWGSHMLSILRSPENRARKSKLAKEMWKNPDFRTRAAIGRARMAGRRSKIETTTSNILDSLNVAYEQQVPFGPYVYDFFVLEKHLFIEVQGEYWHSSDRAMARDEAKRKYLLEASPNSRLVYLHERDFLNPQIVRQKLIDSLHGNGVGNFDLNDFKLSDVNISSVERNQAREFLNAFHYAQFGRAAKLCISASLESDIIAVCKFSNVVRKEVATSMNKNPSQVLELDRLAIHPCRHKKNFASWFISRCTSLVFNTFERVDTLVSFADTNMGHVGSIYLASGWKLVATVPPDYHYVNSDGWMMHKKTLYNHAVSMKMKEREYAEKFGYVKVKGKCKFKFIKVKPEDRLHK